MTIRQIVLAALTAALSAGASGVGQGGRARAALYDLIEAGPHECAGPSAGDRAPDEWAYAPQGAR